MRPTLGRAIGAFRRVRRALPHPWSWVTFVAPASARLQRWSPRRSRVRHVYFPRAALPAAAPDRGVPMRPGKASARNGLAVHVCRTNGSRRRPAYRVVLAPLRTRRRRRAAAWCRRDVRGGRAPLSWGRAPPRILSASSATPNAIPGCSVILARTTRPRRQLREAAGAPTAAPGRKKNPPSGGNVPRGRRLVAAAARGGASDFGANRRSRWDRRASTVRARLGRNELAHVDHLAEAQPRRGS